MDIRPPLNYKKLIKNSHAELDGKKSRIFNRNIKANSEFTRCVVAASFIT